MHYDILAHVDSSTLLFKDNGGQLFAIFEQLLLENGDLT